MKSKVPPADADLTLTSHELARRYGVGRTTAHRWKQAAGIPMKRGGYGGMQRQSAKLWSRITEEDWLMGCVHVAKLMGVSKQAAQQMRHCIERYRREGRRSPEAA